MYFEVVAKCGHVGRGKYYEGHFFTVSESASEAAQAVKHYHRVKKDHKDAILSTTRIDEKTYKRGIYAQNHNPYFFCSSKKEQNLHWDEIEPFVRDETDRAIEYRRKNNKAAIYEGRDGKISHHKSNIHKYKQSKELLSCDSFDDYMLSDDYVA